MSPGGLSLTRFTVGLEEQALLLTRFTVGLVRSLPHHPFHCWAEKEGEWPALASRKVKKEGRMARSSLPEEEEKEEE